MPIKIYFLYLSRQKKLGHGKREYSIEMRIQEQKKNAFFLEEECEKERRKGIWEAGIYMFYDWN